MNEVPRYQICELVERPWVKYAWGSFRTPWVKYLTIKTACRSTRLAACGRQEGREVTLRILAPLLLAPCALVSDRYNRQI